MPALKGLHPLGSVPPNQILHLLVQVPFRDRAGLNALLAAQDDLHSALFHHYLSPAQFTSRFGPLPQTTKQVADFLSGQGLHVETVSANRSFINVTGSASNVEHAFALQLDDYSYEGRLVFAPLNEPSVPASLNGMIQGISGLNDVAILHHQPRVSPVTIKQPRGKSPHDPGGCYPAGYGPTTFDYAYDLWPLLNAGYNGKGQTIDLVEFDGGRESDITPFDQCFGLTAPIWLSNVYITYQNRTASSTPLTFGGAVEADLDMEVAHEIAPGAALRFYFGLNDGYDSNTDGVYFYMSDGILPVFDTLVARDDAQLVSTSWIPACEENIGGVIQAADMAHYDADLTQGASEGTAFFQGSGDDGSDDCNNHTASIDVLTGDPHVVTVGGTQYTPASDGTRGSEVAWGGSGGGQSTFFPTPFYQLLLPSGSVYPTMRGVPDVSADAYVNPTFTVGYSIYCDVQNLAPQNCPGWLVVGGTSAAVPLWAGIIADINSYLTAQGKTTMGTTVALLYQMDWHDASALHDITSGSNGAYSAGTGYDLVTGLGSPDAWKIASDLFNQVQVNTESDIVWGVKQSNGDVDLMAAAFHSDTGAATLVDVTQLISQISANPNYTFQLIPNAGPPAIVSYPTQGDGTEVDVFALATDPGGTAELHGFTYLPGSGAWTDLGTVVNGGTNPLPNRNPVAIVQGAPAASTVALFGITNSGHVMEYYQSNSGRLSGGTFAAFTSRDISAQTGITCQGGISPAAVMDNTNEPVIFADCSNKLVEFYTNGGGTYYANTSLPGNSIPNASAAFPGHSIAALVVPGNPGAIEAYVASDRNGANALSEYLYNGSTWSNLSVPLVAGHTPDQLHARTVVLTGNTLTPISQIIATDPAGTSCSSQPASVQYLYQPQLSNPAWHGTVLSGTGKAGITSMAAMDAANSTVTTEAYTGAYLGTGTAGAYGGGGCSTNGAVYEAYSVLSSAATQGWASNALGPGDTDNAGIDPAGTMFPY